MQGLPALLTEKYLQSLTETSDGKRISDRDSMYGIVRVGKKGVSVLFRWRFRFQGKHHDFNCGTWPAVKLSALRQARRDAEAVLSDGRNPNDEKRVERLRSMSQQRAELRELSLALLKARTVEEAAREWFSSPTILGRKDRGDYVKRAFAKDIFPKLGSVALCDLKRGMVMDVLMNIAKRAPVMANRCHAQLNQLFEYCCAREWASDNPLKGTRRDMIGGAEPPRQRILCHESDQQRHELLELKNAIELSGLPKTAVAAIWLVLGTACRIGELVQARWQHVDFVRREWHIPAENSKNGRPHIVYLSDFALGHFLCLRELTGSSEWCFPGTAGTHLGVKTITKQIGDRQKIGGALSKRTSNSDALLLSGGRWTPHDLRRTAATLMGHCCVSSEIIECVLNHTQATRLKKVYQRSIPRESMAKAWISLGQRLNIILDTSSNVHFSNFGEVA